MNTITSYTLPQAITLNEVVEANRNDVEFGQLIELLRYNANNERLPRNLGEYKQVFSELSFANGVLLRGRSNVIPS